VDESGVVGLIDFGMVGHLTDDLKGHLGTLILALVRGHVNLVVDVYRELGVFPESVGARELKTDIQEMMDRTMGVPIGKLETARVFQDILRLARKHKGVLPRDFVLLGKSLVAVAGLAKRLDPDFNLVEKAKPYTRKLIQDKFSPGRMANYLVEVSWTLSNLLLRLPSDLSAIARKFREGRIQGVIRHEGLENLVEEVDRSANRISLSMLLASMVMGSALFTLADVGPRLIGDIPLLGSLGFLVTAIAGIFLVIAILRSGRI
jgi:ubiquinone biosynthesis protein